MSDILVRFSGMCVSSFHGGEHRGRCLRVEVGGLCADLVEREVDELLKVVLRWKYRAGGP